MHLIHAPLAVTDASLPEISVGVDRRKLARRLWRATAADGTEFGIEVGEPLRHGDVVWADESGRYVIRQTPEAVLVIPLDLPPAAAAVIGWAVGNLHLPIEPRDACFLVPDDPGLRPTLDRLGVAYDGRVEVFQPHRLAGSLAGHGRLADRTREFSPDPDHGHACPV